MKTKFYLTCTLLFMMTVNLLSNHFKKGLFDAVEKCDKAKVEEMLALGADVNSKNEDGLTPLMVAARNKNCSIDILKLLVEKGADINAQSEEFGDTTLMFTDDDLEKTKYLVSKGADPNKPSKITIIGGGHNAVAITTIWSSITGDLSVLEFLLKNGGDVNKVLPNGESILIYSLYPASNNEYGCKVIETLLKNGADVNYKMNDGNTALLKAIDYYAINSLVKSQNLEKSMKLVELLLKYGADPNCQREELSLKKKDVDSYDPKKYKGGDTPLYLAKINGLKELEELLIQYGATKTPVVKE